VNDEIARLLKARDYELTGDSSTGKAVKKFQQSQISKKLFALMKTDPVYRALGTYVFRRDFKDVDSLAQQTGSINFENTIRESPVKKLACRACHYTICPILKGSQSPTAVCPKCRKGGCLITDDWEAGVDKAVWSSYLDSLRKAGLIARHFEVGCPSCLTVTHYEEGKLTTDHMKCKACKTFNENKWVYTVPEDIRLIWDSNGGGIWLEWYAKELLTKSFPDVLQGVFVRNKKTKKAIEVDCLIARKGKLVSVFSRVLPIDKRGETKDFADLEKVRKFSDVVIVITTTRVSSDVTDFYKGKRVIFIEGKDIEALPEVMFKQFNIPSRKKAIKSKDFGVK